MQFNDTIVNGVPAYGCDLTIEFALFDRLPKELRDLLNYAPIKTATFVLYQQKWATIELRPDIAESWKQEFRAAFPDYKPIKGDDFQVDDETENTHRSKGTSIT
jgi:hypothetical protein